MDGTRLGRVVALAVLQADGLHQLGRGPVNRPIVRQERTGPGRNVDARNVEQRFDAWTCNPVAVVGISYAAARPKLEVTPRIRRDPSERQGRVDVL